MSSKLVLKNRKLSPVLRFRQIVATTHNNRNEDVLIPLGLVPSVISFVPTIGLVAGTPGFDKLFALIPAFTMAVGLKFLFSIREEAGKKAQRKVTGKNFVTFYKDNGSYSLKEFSTTERNPYFDVKSKLVNWDVFSSASKKQKKELIKAIDVYYAASADWDKAKSLKASLTSAEKSEPFVLEKAIRFNKESKAMQDELVAKSMQHVSDAFDVATKKLAHVVASIMYPEALPVSTDRLVFEIGILAEKASVLAAEKDFS